MLLMGDTVNPTCRDFPYILIKCVRGRARNSIEFKININVTNEGLQWRDRCFEEIFMNWLRAASINVLVSFEKLRCWTLARLSSYQAQWLIHGGERKLTNDIHIAQSLPLRDRIKLEMNVGRSMLGGKTRAELREQTVVES
jgi:hypothetical protein